MEEMLEYLIPLKGVFKKKRDPKIIDSLKSLEDFDEIAEDFRTAESYFDDAVRLGQKCIFRKEKVTVFYVKDVVSADFRIYGEDSIDRFAKIVLLFRDGSEEVLLKTNETDSKVAGKLFSALEILGIKIKN